MKKKLFAGILATLMCVVCAVAGLTACSDNNDDKKETVKITEGVYDGTYTGGGYKQDNYIRFQEEGEIFEGKRTFYYHAYSGEGATAYAMVKPILGVYEVLDQEITIKCWQSGNQRSADTGGVFEDRTADKTVVLKSLDGATEYCRTGWDTKENKLLGIPAVSADLGVTVGNTMGVSTQYGNYCLLNKTDERVDRGVALYTYYCDTETVRNASLVIYHNGTYDDNKVTGTETVTGTYTVSGSTYTLTAGEGATGGSLVIATNGATFTPTGGTAITMATVKARETVQVYTGTGILTGNTTESTLTVTLYDDGSAELTGMGNPVEGTWTESNGAKAITLIGADLYPETDTDDDGTYYYFEINGVTVRTVSIPANIAIHTYSGSAMNGTYDETILNLYSDGTAVLDAQKVGSTAYPKVHAEGTYDGRTVTVTYNGTDLVLTITENAEGDGYVVTGGAPLNVELTGTTAPEAGTPDNPPAPVVTTLYTLEGNASGYDQSGSTVDYPYALKLNDDYSFELILTNPSVGASLTAAKGTWEVLTSGENAGKYQLTITESSYFEVNSTLLVTVTYNSDYSAVTSLTVEIPAISSIYLSGATLTYSSIKTLYTLEGNATGYDQSGSTVDYPYALKLNDDYSFELILTNPSVGASLTAAKGTWEVLTSGENAGKYQLTISESSYFEVNSTLLVAVTYNSDYSAVTSLTVEIPAISSIYLSGATLTYTIPSSD